MVGLLVDQYKDGGMKLLDNHTKLRSSQKINMGNDIIETRLQLAKIYTSAKDSVEKMKHDIARSPVSNFEKQWKKEQESIQVKLSQLR